MQWILTDICLAFENSLPGHRTQVNLLTPAASEVALTHSQSKVTVRS